MEAAESWAQGRGYRRLVVHAQVRVVDFYLRLGYTKIPRPPFEEAGILHVAMEKNLIHRGKSPAPYRPMIP